MGLSAELPNNTGIGHLWATDPFQATILWRLFVAYDHETRRMIICISPLNNLTTISWGMTFSYCPTFHQLAESLNRQTIH